MSAHIIRAADYRRMRWKNGQGETAEVAVGPPGATLDGFHWRISMAEVGADGPFSAFDGVDRTLTVVSGAGLRLAPVGAPPVELTTTSEPFPFAGDLPTDATLLGGPITDLNVMTRRDRAWHRVRRLLGGGIAPDGDAKAAFVIVPGPGAAVLVVDGVALQLGALDALDLGATRGRLEIRDAGPTGVLLVEIGLR
jgi:hypothetical protein